MKIWKIDISWARIRKSLIIRIIGTMFMLAYIYMGLTALNVWAHVEWNKHLDISHLSVVIDEAVAQNDLEDIATWLRYRPLSDTDDIIAIVTPKSGLVGADVFLDVMRREINRGHIEEAVFWLHLAQFRLRYDILRCGGGNSAKDISELLSYMTPEKVEALIREKPELGNTSIKRVLDFDTQYPAANAPDHICHVLNKLTRINYVPTPREDWENIRKNLRAAAEDHLAQETKK